MILMSHEVLIAVAAHCAYPLFTDLRTRRISNKWNAGMATVGLSYHSIASGATGLGYALLGGLLLLSLAALLSMIRAIGGGDAKWFTALGVWCGTAFAFRVLLAALLFAGVYSLLYLMYRGALKSLVRQWIRSFILFVVDRRLIHLRTLKLQRVHEMPFMAAAVPAVVTLVWINGGIGS